VGVSGGVDSAVTLALCVRAFAPQQIVALLLPEMDSSPESIRLGRQVCRQLGIAPLVENLTAALFGFGCYRRRDDAVRAMVPDYDETHRLKITLPPSTLDQASLNVYSVVTISPEGHEQKKRLRARELRQIVAATNFKQRARAAMLFYYADLHNYAVIGTPPKNEHDMGFFVKFGDGAMDVKPLGHLYKSQVYQLAEYLEVPEEIRSRPPTSDTYSAGSSQEEFFFRLPHQQMDLLWYGWENAVPPDVVAREMELREAQVRHAFADFDRRTQTTAYLRTPPLGCNE
jgi:NAD+ synthase